jgi:hypothetical protein
MSERLKTGQRVRIRSTVAGGDWAEGVVALASGNGESVGLLLDVPVRIPAGIIGGALPLLIDYEAETVEDLFGNSYVIDVRGEQVTYQP